MITSLSVSRFRAFDSMHVNDMERINLFVGKNGCGKTSILEAVSLLATEGSPQMLFEILEGRGEVVDREKRDYRTEYDTTHLFYGHQPDLGSSFKIEGTNETPVRISCKLDLPEDEASQMDLFGRAPEAPFYFLLSIETSSQDRPILMGLSPEGGIDSRRVAIRNLRETGAISRVNFVGTHGLSVSDMGQLWDDIALTAEEEKVVEAVRILEPTLQGIAFLARQRQSIRARDRRSSGIYAKLNDVEPRLPLGCLGDGMRRLLGLALAVIQSRGTYVMIDEIDTGLHHSMMNKMWEMVIRTAERLDVQVFATTHSSDCLRGLAALQRENPGLCKNVRVHRIETDLGKAVTYSAEEVLTADKHKVEVRGIG